MINITDHEVLHKIIEFQSCIIEGKSVKALLHKNTDFFLSKTQADTITIYMHTHEYVKPEYILSRNRHFEHQLKKYIFGKKNFRWHKFVKNCNIYFKSGLTYEKVTEMYQIFKGFMRKKDADAFTKEMQIKHAVVMPIYNFNEKDIIGYTCFIFTSDVEVDIEKIQTVKKTFETLLRPLYDQEYHTIYNKCVRLDENMDCLTTQERVIVKKVLKGMSYTEIAEILSISINTLKSHMKNIFNKYNVTSKIELFHKLHIMIK